MGGGGSGDRRSLFERLDGERDEVELDNVRISSYGRLGLFIDVFPQSVS